MLGCHSCLWHCLRAITQRSPLAHPPNALVRNATLQRLNGQRLSALSLRRRNYATHITEEDSTGVADNVFAPDEIRPPRPRRESRNDPYLQSKLNQQRKQVVKTNLNYNYNAKDPAEARLLKKEIAYLGHDPLRLAEYVLKTLQKDDMDKALSLVRYASKEMRCTVSWNHVIDKLMATSHVNKAIKIYNEMKKRGQVPDSYTYTIVLRGLGANAHLPNSLGYALSVYHSMSAPNSKLTPMTMHTNAALKVCARANDMDAMWGIAAKIPDSGPGAADSLTFSTILNAIRYNALDAPVGLNEDQIAAKREQAIIDGRRIWEDIVGKWRSGDLVIDELLVCTMGRLLLVGNRPRDWDDVLSLVEQTMNIPRLVPHLGAGPRPGPELRLPHTPKAMKEEDMQPIDMEDQWRRGGEFDPVDSEVKTVGKKGRHTMAYAKPTNNTLSLVMESCLKMVAKKTAMDYWNLLTDPQSYNIQPDLDNLHMCLRVLRQSRSANEAVTLLRDEMEGRGIRPYPKTFRIAMSACARDMANPNTFQNGMALMDLMHNTLPDVDVRTVVMFTNLAFHARRGADVLAALDRLGPAFINLKSMLNYGKDGGEKAKRDERDDAIEALRQMIRCYDRLLNKGEVPREQYSELMQRRSKISAYVQRAIRKDMIEKGIDVRNPLLNPEKRKEIEEMKQRGEEAEPAEPRKSTSRNKSKKQKIERAKNMRQKKREMKARLESEDEYQ